MSLYYTTTTISGIERLDNSNNVINLYSYGDGSQISNFLPTLSGDLITNNNKQFVITNSIGDISCNLSTG